MEFMRQKRWFDQNSVVKTLGSWVTFRKNWQLLILTIPALTCYILFSYMPMFGAVIAFKDYRYNKGIFGSAWNGLQNFKYLFSSQDFTRIVRNTVLYSFTFMVVGMVVAVTIALLMYEITNRKLLKAYQTSIMLPNFLSWVLVGFITYAIFNPTLGILNQIIDFFEGGRVDVYTNSAVWPLIFIFVNLWKGIGMGSLIYYAALMGIDAALYDAAKIDGANRWQQTMHISIPGIVPIISISIIMAIGNIFEGDFGLFYQIPRNIGMLYETTDIIETYVFRGLQGGSIAVSSAVGFLQSFVGLIMVVAANYVVRKISPENSLF